MGRYIKRPAPVEAIQWDGTQDTEMDIMYLIGGCTQPKENGDLGVPTKWGDIQVPEGYWVIKDEEGEIWAYHNDAFHQMYMEEVITMKQIKENYLKNNK